MYENIAKIFRTVDVSSFKEEEHPRDETGKFSAKKGSTSPSIITSKFINIPDNLKQKTYSSGNFNEWVRENKQELKENDLFNPDIAKEFYREMKYDKPVEYKPLSKEQAIKDIRSEIPQNILDGWFREADSRYKQKIEDIVLNSDKARNAALNIAWDNYKYYSGENNISLDEFLNKEIPVYRGKASENYVSGDEVLAYSYDPKIANKFAGSNGVVKERMIKPKDTLRSFQTTAEFEILVRRI